MEKTVIVKGSGHDMLVEIVERLIAGALERGVDPNVRVVCDTAEALDYLGGSGIVIYRSARKYDEANQVAIRHYGIRVIMSENYDVVVRGMQTISL